MKKITPCINNRNVLIIFIVLISTFLASCAIAYEDEKPNISYNSEVYGITEVSKVTETPEIWEFKLVSCYIESRDITNQFGWVTGHEKYLHYGFENEGEVIFKEKQMYSTYNYINYRLKLELNEEEPKIIQQNKNGKTVLTFKMTQEMYDKLFTEEN